jgi:hypothetical protein
MVYQIFGNIHESLLQLFDLLHLVDSEVDLLRSELLMQCLYDWLQH